MESVIQTKFLLLILLILLSALLSTTLSDGLTAKATTVDFIIASCRTTQYPALCVESLAGFASVIRRSPRQLALTALSVSQQRSAQATSALVSQMSSGPLLTGTRDVIPPTGAYQDCVQTLGDAVNMLRRSARELRRMGRPGSRRYNVHLNNLVTWVSAAISEQSSCLVSLSEDPAAIGVPAAMRSRIVDVSRITRNALAFVSRLSYGRN